MIMQNNNLRKSLTKGHRYYKQGRLQEARKAFERAIKLDSKCTDAWHSIGLLLMHQGLYRDAVKCFQNVINITPDNASAQGNLGIAFYHLQQLDDAIYSYKQVLRLQPDNTTAMCNIAMTLLDLGERDAAAEYCDKAISIQPEYAAMYTLKGAILSSQGQFELAILNYQKANALDNSNIEVIAGWADALIKLGMNSEAYELIAPHITTEINNVTLAATYANTHAIHGNSNNACKILEGLLNKHNLTHKERLQLHFSAGKLYDKIGSYDKAFSHFQRGNNYAAREYTTQSDDTFFNNIKTSFTRDRLSILKHSVQSGVLPVFIVGMPRSGTSLTEKILSRHSKTHAAGELPDIPNISNILTDKSGNTIRFPEDIHLVEDKCINQLSRQYLDKLASLANRESVVTDKLPHNFLFLGLIELLFPKSRIIHCIRNPIDTCLSNYFQYFSSPLNYAYKLENIANHYNQYHSLMSHWKDNLDLDILEIEYEDLVKNQENTSRKIINFCGLEWEDECLSFYESNEITRTASYEQTQQPIYKQSVDRWKNYKKHIKQLIDKLDYPT